MTLHIVQCPHCNTRVVVNLNGYCPSCARPIEPSAEGPALEAPELDPGERPPTTPQLAARFHEELRSYTPLLVATPVIIAANVVVYFVMVASGAHFLKPAAEFVLNWGANYGPRTMNGQWWRLVTSMFLHFGLLHLACNMYILWFLGRLVERLVGNVGFVCLYFVSGIAGSLASLAWNPQVVSAGASGAVFGVAGGLLGLLALRRGCVPGPVLSDLRESLIVLVFFNIIYGMIAGGIDQAAHVGGLVAGFFCGVALSQKLQPEMVQGRWSRNLGVLVAGCTLLPLAAWALPPAPPDLLAIVNRVVKVEADAIEQYNQLIEKQNRGEISLEQFADELETILAKWTEVRKQVDRLLPHAPPNRKNLHRLAEYLATREDSWRLQMEGYREQNAEKLQKARELSQTADRMAQQSSKPQ